MVGWKSDKALYDGTATSIEWGTRRMFDGGGNISIEYGQRLMYDANTQALSVNWDARRLFNPANGNKSVIDWNMDEGYLKQWAVNSEIGDGMLQNSEFAWFIDEATNEIKVKVKYADGVTVKVGTLAIV